MLCSRLTSGAQTLALVAVVSLAVSCVRTPPPVTPDAPPPPPSTDRADTPPPPPAPTPPPPAPPVIGDDDPFSSRSLEELNRESPLEPAFFQYDSSELDLEGRSVLESNAEVLRRYPTWVITVEGHCDERGTPEYNLALGERRALVARDYLVELGLSADRVRTVSYGKEFPFDPGGNEAAWAANRRAHLVITGR